uniref:Subtilisin-like protease fibronectin type-III domain-containing protein n=1 Tax=Oryza brachyantha TaxID=4533 RepID=J3LVC5_ORYBR
MYGLPILANGLPQKIADPFDYGGGFIDPNRAADPGLAYDVDPKDYIGLNCEFANTSCEYKYLNLPSIAVPNLKAPTTLLRTVINVAQADAVYKAVVQSPPGVHTSVEPSVLKIQARHEEAELQGHFQHDPKGSREVSVW